MGLAGAQLAQRIGPSTRPFATIQAIWFRAFSAYFLVLKSPKIGKKPLTKWLSFSRQSLARVVLVRRRRFFVQIPQAGGVAPFCGQASRTIEIPHGGNLCRRARLFLQQGTTRQEEAS